VKHEHVDVRRHVSEFVKVLGPQAPQCINEFAKLFHDEDQEARSGSAKNLRYFGNDALKYASCLEELCSKGEWPDSNNAMLCLPQSGAHAKSHMNTVTDMIAPPGNTITGAAVRWRS